MTQTTIMMITNEVTPQILKIPWLSSLSFNDIAEKMEAFYGTEKVISEELLFFCKARQHLVYLL
ncbi:MAG: hypothetical protein WA364_27950 [Candidatus Nitrosopolaris sp.]|jgi:hypothetical protein